MKNLILASISLLTATFSLAQFERIEVEQIDNGGIVPGKTYRVWVVLTNDSDRVDVVFGDSLHQMLIQSTKPFYQSSYGGALTTEVNKKLAEEKPELRYDSWVTIGATDNTTNGINNFLMSFEEFEKGGKIQTNNGAWFCTPDHKQVYAFNDKKHRVLIAQLTSEGKITGNVSLQGKTEDGTLWQKFNQSFSCGK